MESQIENLQVTELRLITDRKDFEGGLLSPFYTFEGSFEKTPIFVNLDVSELASFLVEEVEIEGLDRRGDVFQMVKVWKRDEKTYLDIGEYLRYLREPM